MAEPTTDAAVEPVLGSGPVPAETEQAEVKEQPEKVEPEQKADDETESTEEQKPKRKGGWQRKIEKLEQEVELWRDQALKTQSSSPNDPPTGPAKPTAPKLSTFQGTVEEFEKAQEKYAQELEAYTQQTAEQRVMAKRAEQATNEVLTKLQSMEDYDDIDEAAQEYMPHDLLRPLASECAMFKNGAEVFRELIVNPDEREELLNMHEMRDIAGIKAQLRILARTLRKQPQAAASPNPASRAPKPLTPVTKPAPTDTGLSDDLSVEEWVRRREAQVNKKR